MLDSKGFDKWSGKYDETIKNSKGYPFEGYYNVLGYVQNQIDIKKRVTVLDLGIGTGLLTFELYSKGIQICGADFSEGMINQAKKKMPLADFYQFDFTSGLPVELQSRKFDYIISSYAIHHINGKSKIDLIKQLQNNLEKDGRIFFADVAFETIEKAEECKKRSGKEWDSNEYYMVGTEIVAKLLTFGIKASYRQISICAGVLEIENK